MIDLPINLPISRSSSQLISRYHDLLIDLLIDIDIRELPSYRSPDIPIIVDPRGRVQQHQALIHQNIFIKLPFNIQSPDQSPGR